MSVCSLILSSIIPKVNFRMPLISCLLFLPWAQAKQDSFEGGPHRQLQFRKITITSGICRLILNALLAHHQYFFFLTRSTSNTKELAALLPRVILRVDDQQGA